MSALHVICRVADAEYAIGADLVRQMESFTGATPVPGTPPYVAGLVQIRQQVIPVVDLRVRFGLTPIEPALSSRVIVLEVGERVVGMLVDCAREVQNIPPENFRPPPEVVVKQSAGFVRSVAQFKDRIIMLLDAAKVIGEEPLHA